MGGIHQMLECGMRQLEKNCGKIVEELWKHFARACLAGKNCRKIIPQLFPANHCPSAPANIFYNSSTILLQFFLVRKNLVHPDWLGKEL
jgi:hypothetical protein